MTDPNRYGERDQIHGGKYVIDIDPTSLEPFGRPTRDDWMHAVDDVLARGATGTDEQRRARFERELVSETYGGLRIEPLYTSEDLAGIDLETLPGSPPFLRGAAIAGPVVGGWEVRQRIVVGADPEQTAARARDELERGTTGLWLDLRACDGIDVDLLDEALTGIFVELVPITLDAGSAALTAAQALIGLWGRRGLAPREWRGRLGLDPFGDALRAGGTRAEVERRVAAIADLMTGLDADAVSVRALVADATSWHAAGASDTDEIAALIAAGVQQLRWLDTAGIAPQIAARQLEFRVTATADQFMTIAKIRAARVLWNRVCGEIGIAPESGSMRMHVVGSPAMLTRYDPWVNLLRSTVACFAAGVAGADAITIDPYDLLVDGGSTLGRRLARNTQAILIDEAHIARVIDPAGGSFYVEHLTRSFAETAWGTFAQMERLGGYLEALVSGWAHERCRTTWDRRRSDLATRRAAITGVSEFPDLSESPPPTRPAAAKAGAQGSAGTDLIAALPRHRHAEQFEALRDAMANTEPAAVPEVLLIGLGSTAEQAARNGFARNFFEVGGLRTLTVDAGEFDPVTDPRRWAEALGVDLDGALVCVCSTDERYRELGVAAVRALRAAGVATVALAGRPRDVFDDLAAAGVDEFIAVGTDVIDVLQRILSGAGIEVPMPSGDER